MCTRHTATAYAYAQDEFIRDRRRDEPAEEYQAYLDERRARRVLHDEVAITKNDQGHFSFPELQQLLLSQTGGRRGWHLAYYSVDIVDAQTEEDKLDDESLPVPGETETLLFAHHTSGTSPWTRRSGSSPSSPSTKSASSNRLSRA